MRRLAAALALALAVAACGGSPSTSPPMPDAAPAKITSTAHSGTIAISADGKSIYVVNADADSVSIVDTGSRALTQEILLAPAHPSVDGSGAYTPAVMPRTLSLSPDGATLWTAGQRSGALYAIDLATGAVSAPIAVGSEPAGVLASPDGKSVYVAVGQDGTVVRVDVATMQVVATAQIGGQPWGLAFQPSDGSLIATLLLGPTLVALDPTTLAIRSTPTIPDTAPRGDQRLAHGQARGFYDAAARPNSDELWVTHVLLGTDTAQPALNFESTVFPALSLLVDGNYQRTLTTDAQDVAGVDGAFADVVSGPHAIAFTADGAYALVADTHSEDVLAVDAHGDVEATLLRPLPGHMPEGIAISPDGATAYIDERNTADIAVVSIATSGGAIALAVDGAAIPRLAADPMPAQMRLGQHLFYSSNSDEYPITQNHWVACASCHLEGRSDAVTWKFAQGPRDTPSNAGGTLGTGLLFRTADRNVVQDYWRTINTEQGGNFGSGTSTQQVELLDAIETYVDHALPLPIPPTTDPVKVAAGKLIFERSDVGCSGCHSGPRFTDSGGTLASPNLHDGTNSGSGLGTCVTTGYPDVAHDDIDGDPRAACNFDTPSLSGVASSPPYLHDGSAPTLLDVLENTRGKMGDITSLSADDEAALVEYLRSL